MLGRCNIGLGNAHILCEGNSIFFKGEVSGRVDFDRRHSGGPEWKNLLRCGNLILRTADEPDPTGYSVVLGDELTRFQCSLPAHNVAWFGGEDIGKMSLIRLRLENDNVK